MGARLGEFEIEAELLGHLDETFHCHIGRLPVSRLVAQAQVGPEAPGRRVRWWRSPGSAWRAGHQTAESGRRRRPLGATLRWGSGRGTARRPIWSTRSTSSSGSSLSAAVPRRYSSSSGPSSSGCSRWRRCWRRRAATSAAWPATARACSASRAAATVAPPGRGTHRRVGEHPIALTTSGRCLSRHPWLCRWGR